MNVMCLSPWAAEVAAMCTPSPSVREKVFEGTHEQLAEIQKKMNRYKCDAFDDFRVASFWFGNN